VAVPHDLDSLTELLWEAGFVAADEEAEDLLRTADGDGELLDALVARRLTGEPIAWITGRISFCGLELRVDPGVYVPRWHTEPLARRAAERLPDEGTAIDLCTGTGAIAAVLAAARPAARVVATDLDERAVVCARANGVDAYHGDLFAPVPAELFGRVDVVAGVVPYVPTPSLSLLQRDTFAFESGLSYDGGDDGADVLRRVLVDSRAFLGPGGALLLELGGDQAGLLGPELERLCYGDVKLLFDEEDDVRGIEVTLTGPRSPR
jgi:release factor glutamine methyltransferase